MLQVIAFTALTGMPQSSNPYSSNLIWLSSSPPLPPLTQNTSHKVSHLSPTPPLFPWSSMMHTYPLVPHPPISSSVNQCLIFIWILTPPLPFCRYWKSMYPRHQHENSLINIQIMKTPSIFDFLLKLPICTTMRYQDSFFQCAVLTTWTMTHLTMVITFYVCYRNVDCPEQWQAFLLIFQSNPLRQFFDFRHLWVKNRLK